ncbi:MAG TPA: ABC transporter substrate-binding protein [Acidobacteriota bacterium]|nr:ABC transporter substrate-binding protein [Acidobacteriota bacterium]
MRSIRALGLSLAAVLLLLLAGALAQLGPDAQRGREIYKRGTAPDSEEIIAVISGSGTRIPAAAMPCESCHGIEGVSSVQGSLSPSDISWPALTRPMQSEKRSRPAYDEAKLRRSITLGYDSAGNELSASMPRYLFTRKDLDDLVEYMKTLGTGQEPGLSHEAIALATLLPAQGRLAEQGTAVEAALRAGLQEINQGGGVAGRRLKLQVVEAPLDPSQRLEAMRALLQDGSVFALVSPFFIGAEELMSGLAEEFGVPVIAPMTLRPRLGDPVNPYVFYLQAGLQDQCRAMIRFASSAAGSNQPQVSVLVSSDGRFDRAAQAVEAQAAALGWPAPRRAVCPPQGCHQAIFESLRKAESDILVVLLPAPQVRPTLRQADQAGWRPRVFLPSLLFSAALFGAPGDFTGRLFVSYPVLPPDLPPKGRDRMRQMALSEDLAEDYRLLQAGVLGAVEVLAEGLRRAGREVGQRRLVLQLQTLQGYATGFTRPVTYSPYRRVGILGAHVVPVDLAGSRLELPGVWVELN